MQSGTPDTGPGSINQPLEVSVSSSPINTTQSGEKVESVITQSPFLFHSPPPQNLQSHFSTPSDFESGTSNKSSAVTSPSFSSRTTQPYTSYTPLGPSTTPPLAPRISSTELINRTRSLISQGHRPLPSASAASSAHSSASTSSYNQLNLIRYSAYEVPQGSFERAALRTPEHYEILIKALRAYDQELAQRKIYAILGGTGYRPIMSLEDYLGHNREDLRITEVEEGLEVTERKDGEKMQVSVIPAEYGGSVDELDMTAFRDDDEKGGKIEVMEDTEDDEEKLVEPSAKKKKKKSKNKKKKPNAENSTSGERQVDPSFAGSISMASSFGSTPMVRTKPAFTFSPTNFEYLSKPFIHPSSPPAASDSAVAAATSSTGHPAPKTVPSVFGSTSKEEAFTEAPTKDDVLLHASSIPASGSPVKKMDPTSKPFTPKKSPPSKETDQRPTPVLSKPTLPTIPVPSKPVKVDRTATDWRRRPERPVHQPIQPVVSADKTEAQSTASALPQKAVTEVRKQITEPVKTVRFEVKDHKAAPLVLDEKIGKKPLGKESKFKERSTNQAQMKNGRSNQNDKKVWSDKKSNEKEKKVEIKKENTPPAPVALPQPSVPMSTPTRVVPGAAPKPEKKVKRSGPRKRDSQGFSEISDTSQPEYRILRRDEEKVKEERAVTLPSLSGQKQTEQEVEKKEQEVVTAVQGEDTGPKEEQPDGIAVEVVRPTFESMEEVTVHAIEMYDQNEEVTTLSVSDNPGLTVEDSKQEVGTGRSEEAFSNVEITPRTVGINGTTTASFGALTSARQGHTLTTETEEYPITLQELIDFDHHRASTAPALLSSAMDSMPPITINLPLGQRIFSAPAAIPVPVQGLDTVPELDENTEQSEGVAMEVSHSMDSFALLTPSVSRQFDQAFEEGPSREDAASPVPTEVDTPPSSEKGTNHSSTSFQVNKANEQPGMMLVEQEIEDMEELAQLTSFAPRAPVIPVESEPMDNEDDHYEGEEIAASDSIPTIVLDETPITTPILQPRSLPPSPLRQSISIHDLTPIEPSTLDGPPPPYGIANAWSLYFSDSDKTRIGKRGTITSAEKYQDNLVHLFTAGDLDELFGKWKALRRQIATATKRAIEPIGQPMTKGTYGLGIYSMNDEINFHFFVEGVKPMWEDKMCERGGKIAFTLRSLQASDSAFLDVVLLLISGKMTDSCPTPPEKDNIVVGSTLSRRRGLSRLEVWIGGLTEPNLDWTKAIEVLISEELGGLQVTPYKAFHLPLPAGYPAKVALGPEKIQGAGSGGVSLGDGSIRIGK